jgi:hypothetical protein
MSDATYRKKPDGKRRRKHLDEVNVTGALGERLLPDGRRRIKLTADERKIFSRSEMVETAVRLFLDLESDHSWQAIAEQLGISIMALKDLTKSQEFIDKYDQHFAELGHDPRLRSAQAAIVDLLPMAVKELRELITGGDVPASVKFRAIEKVIELNGIGPQKGGQMDRHELMEFLRGANINLMQNNINAPVPALYEGDISAYVEGRWSDIRSHETSKFAQGKEAEQEFREAFPAQESDQGG